MLCLAVHLNNNPYSVTSQQQAGRALLTAGSLRIDGGSQFGTCVQVLRIDRGARNLQTVLATGSFLLLESLGSLHDHPAELTGDGLLGLLGQILSHQHLALFLLLKRPL
uniref:Uncharacterized protein n=1 Tax=Anopheles atroparvus TaxID=41427 RepID=A0A182J066_ANOAO